MRPVSAAFLRSLSGTHTPVFRATLCEYFQTTTSPIGTRIPIYDGVVTLDGQAGIRSTLDAGFNVRWPTRRDDPGAPYGQEIYVERGIQFSDDLVEYVGLGYHRIEQLDQENPNVNLVRVLAYDRMQGIIEGRLLSPRQFLAGTTIGVIVENLVFDIYPDAVIEWDDNTDESALTRSIIAEDDRYGFLDDVITSHGKIWYWDHRGVLVIKSVPDETQPVYEVRHGRHGVLVSAPRSLTRVNTRNAVVVIGEAGDTETPIRVIVVDDDPTSPTYFFGSFGQVPEFYSSPFITTEDQGTTTGEMLLRRKLGLTYDINFGTIVNPALEPYDPVLVKFSHNEAYQVHVLDTIDVPLNVGQTSTGNAREKRVTLS